MRVTGWGPHGLHRVPPKKGRLPCQCVACPSAAAHTSPSTRAFVPRPAPIQYLLNSDYRISAGTQLAGCWALQHQTRSIGRSCLHGKPLSRALNNFIAQSRARHDSHHAILYSTESHAFIHAARKMVARHHVQERNYSNGSFMMAMFN